MVRSLLLTCALLFSAGMALAQTVLTGKVTDDKGEALIGATVKVLKGTDIVRGTITDYDGNFRVPVDPGRYDVEFSYTGYSTKRVEQVQVLTNQINFLNQMLSEGLVIDAVDIVAYKVPLIEQDKTSGGQTLTSDQIKNLPTRSVNAIVATTAGTTSIDGGEVNIKGSRSNATNYYIDGIRVQGSLPPIQDVEQLQVITGGLGAEYGDVTGGVISLITKGPASELHGSVEVENSHGLDPYGWLLATANVSGPVVKRKKADGTKETVIGFRLSGQYWTQDEDNPPATPVYRVKESLIPLLETHPLILLNGIRSLRAETYTQDSVDVLDARPNEQRRDIDVTGKLDFRLTDNIDLSITGTYKDIQNQFTPGGWLLLNSQNNPTTYNSRYRGIARLRHRLGSSDGSQDATTAKRVSITNASYQLQFGYEHANSKTSDPRHGDRIFDYGYVGRFDYEYVPVPREENNEWKHVGYNRNFTGFTAGAINPGLVAYNEYANPEDDEDFVAINGRFSSLYDDIWSGMHSSSNLVYNSYSKSESDLITIMASSGFDLKLGRTGTHNIQFGLLNEQRIQRAWSMAPSGLWNLMNLTANGHFNGIDTTIVIGTFLSPDGLEVDLHPNKITNLEENRFYKRVRTKFNNAPLDQWVNVHELTPNDLSLDMFSPFELTDQSLLDYYGYDYLGNKSGDDVTFNDFFTQVDITPTDTVRTFPMAPLRPLYQAAYFKDKFSFNKMIFSLGLRVERFDLNSRVMKDPYSLYQIMDANTFHKSVLGAGPAPIGLIPSELDPNNPADQQKIEEALQQYGVYVESESNPVAVAYRKGEQWYYPDGRSANDGSQLFTGGLVNPMLADKVANGDIASRSFKPDQSFEDYVPQINWMPRLAFSFPISDDANFFAHYDILVQRPSSNWEVTPLDYFYFYVPGRTPANNANLRPERVVDYEVGFQQKLNDFSSLKFSAYYRELRDQIQRRTILFVPSIGRYDTYGNIDFGTVKGFTVAYDLRRIQNTEIRLAYTLQFADGTGSNANSQRGLTTRGNLRTLFPLDYDERHNLSAIIDYRFDSGKRYTGPRIGGKDVLANFGANLQVTGVSGRPYTAKLRAERFGGSGTVGSINGNRLPWRFNLDLRVDKSFNLAKAGKRPLNVNVYLRIPNLLNRKNVVGVYSFTGAPDDDGYLATGEGQSVQQGVTDQGKDLNAYLASYSWVLLNPGNFTLPRRVYVGAAFEF